MKYVLFTLAMAMTFTASAQTVCQAQHIGPRNATDGSDDNRSVVVDLPAVGVNIGDTIVISADNQFRVASLFQISSQTVQNSDIVLQVGGNNSDTVGIALRSSNTAIVESDSSQAKAVNVTLSKPAGEFVTCWIAN